MKKNIILISFLLVGININAQEVNLSSNEQYSTTELRNNFTDSEISDLQKITEFFKSQICDKENNDFKNCFYEILPELLEYGWNPILENVDFEKQKMLYKSISKTTFIQIWQFCKSTKLATGVEFKEVCSNHKGNYQKYLLELGKKISN